MRETPAYARELAAMGGAVADCSDSMAADFPGRRLPLSPNIPENRRASLEMELIRTDRRTGEPVYSCTGVAVRGGGCFVAALETSLRSADHLLSAAGTVLPRYAAQVELARSLAAKLDELAANAWLNAAGKPDTSTAGQYQRALDALRLSPSSEKGRAAAPRAPRQASPLSRFTARKQDLEAVG